MAKSNGAVADKPRKRAQKQKEILENGAPIAGEDRIPEVEQIADELAAANSERGALGAKCKELQGDLNKLLKEHRKKIYKYPIPGGTRTLKVQHHEEDKIKIKDKISDAEKEKQQGGRTGQADFGGE